MLHSTVEPKFGTVRNENILAIFPGRTGFLFYYVSVISLLICILGGPLSTQVVFPTGESLSRRKNEAFILFSLFVCCSFLPRINVGINQKKVWQASLLSRRKKGPSPLLVVISFSWSHKLPIQDTSRALTSVKYSYYDRV